MPRGRHRQSSSLSGLLRSLAIGVPAAAAGATALLSADPAVLRATTVLAVVVALTGVYLLRLRERATEQELRAQAIRRQRDEERFDERIAELEESVELAQQEAVRLGRRLTAEKARLARAETENARLLSARARAAAEQTIREVEESRRRAARVRPHALTPEAFAKAAAALRAMERNAAIAQARRVAAEAERRLAAADPDADDRGRHAARAGGRPASPAPEHAPSRPAAAVVPVELRRARPDVPSDSFSFFGRRSRPARPASAPAAGPAATDLADLADVVGDEAYAEQLRYRQAGTLEPEVMVAEARPGRPGPAATTSGHGRMRVVGEPAGPAAGGRDARGTAEHGAAGRAAGEEGAPGSGGGEAPRSGTAVKDAAGKGAAGKDAESESAAGPGAAGPGTPEPGAPGAVEGGSASEGVVDLTADDETEPIDIRMLRAL